MPCISDYQEPNEWEIEHARVKTLLKEVETGKFSKTNFNNAFAKGIYNKTTKEILDTKTAELCGALKKKSAKEISKYSLELQLWWKEHKAADARRKREEAAERKKKRTREGAFNEIVKENNKSGVDYFISRLIFKDEYVITLEKQAEEKERAKARGH